YYNATLPPPSSPLFPYTTLFRSRTALVQQAQVEVRRENLKRGRARGAIGIFSVGHGQRIGFLAGGTTRHPNPQRFITLLRQEGRSEEHTSELQSRFDLVCRLLLE